MRKKNLFFFLILGLFINTSYAQKKSRIRQEQSPKQELVYADKNYLDAIKSVQFYNIEVEQSLPILHLGKPESLLLSFDDLRADVRDYYFSFEHCDSQWKKSSLSSLEYSSGYGEERIRELTRSINTLQNYTHYQVLFPSRDAMPLISGNYLLKVYEDADKSRLVLSRRFYVLEEKSIIDAKMVPPMDINKRKTHQKIELAINTQNLLVNDPNRDIKVLIMQNNRHDVQSWADKPSAIHNNKLEYKYAHQFNFPAGQEFLYADLRSFRLKSSMINSWKEDSLLQIELRTDDYLDNMHYNEIIDENGRFYIRNQDQDDPADISADYAWVTFTLKSSTLPENTYYLLGAFNNFSKTPENRLTYNKLSQNWKIKKLLKQGVYDYLYVSSASNPNFYNTKNAYQIFVYYLNPRLNRDELVGYYELNSSL